MRLSTNRNWNHINTITYGSFKNRSNICIIKDTQMYAFSWPTNFIVYNMRFWRSTFSNVITIAENTYSLNKIISSCWKSVRIVARRVSSSVKWCILYACMRLITSVEPSSSNDLPVYVEHLHMGITLRIMAGYKVFTPINMDTKR